MWDTQRLWCADNSKFLCRYDFADTFKVTRGNVQVCEYGYLQWVFIVDLTVVIRIIIIIIISIIIIKHWISLKMCYK